MAKDFFDRTNELEQLRQKYRTLGQGVLLAVYGRRRVGKTELVKQFMNDLPQKQKFYFYVDLSGKQEILNSLATAVLNQLGETIKFGSFDHFFNYIEEKSNEKFLLVIDEFQRFLDLAPEFITKLQDRWDSKLRHHQLMIIIVGSSIGMMQKITASKAGALYGRATKIKISPFRYVDFRLMFPHLSEEEKIVRYAVFGGTPYYLDKTKKITNTLQAISELVLKKGGELVEEPKNLLEYENVLVHAKYNSILHSIASGKEVLKEMQDFTKISLTTMPAYLKRLDELLDLVGKKDPILGKERLGRYAIRDNFFKFWYKFVFPNQTALNLGNDKMVLKVIEDNLNSYVGIIFEDVVRELLILNLNKKIKGVEFNFEDIGSWWDRHSNEIDIVAYNHKEKKIILGEVKWTNKAVDIDVLETLQERAKLVHFNGRYQYVIVSKNGFTVQCLSKMKELSVLHLDLKEITTLLDEVY